MPGQTPPPQLRTWPSAYIGATGTDVTAETSRATSVEATKASRLTRTTVKSGTFSVNAGDLTPIDLTSGSAVATLPTAPADGARIALKAILQGSTSYTMTMNCGGSDVFNKAGGATSAVTPSPQNIVGFLWQVEYDATTHIWTIVADDQPFSVLDDRYDPAGAAAAMAIVFGA